MKVRLTLVALALTALVAAGCGSSSNSSSSSAAASASSGSGSGKSCKATIAIEGPFTGPVAQVGLEQLHFAQLAVADDNKANGTDVTLAQDDTQLTPSIATQKTQSIIATNAVAASSAKRVMWTSMSAGIGPGCTDPTAATMLLRKYAEKL